MRTGVLIAMALALTCAVGCGTGDGPTGRGGASTGPAAEPAALDAQAVMRAKCTACHQLDPVESHHFDRATWTATVDRMMGHGAQLKPEERSAIIEFLTRRDQDLPKTEH